MTWLELAQICYVNYGVHVDWDERFFECPECGEPIYEEDWEPSDFSWGYGKFVCPICEGLLYEDEDEPGVVYARKHYGGLLHEG